MSEFMHFPFLFLLCYKVEEIVEQQRRVQPSKLVFGDLQVKHLSQQHLSDFQHILGYKGSFVEALKHHSSIEPLYLSLRISLCKYLLKRQ